MKHLGRINLELFLGSCQKVLADPYPMGRSNKHSPTKRKVGQLN